MTNAIHNRRTILALVVVLFALGSAVVPMDAASADQNDPPPTPASYYGTVEDEGGGQPADGTTIVAVGYDADGDVIDQESIEVQDGQYGGPNGFDDKLRIQSDADSVAFYVGERNGTALTPTDENPEAGVHEWDLTAEGETFGGTVTTPTPTPTQTPMTTPTSTPTLTDSQTETDSGTTKDDTSGSGGTELRTETGTPSPAQTTTATESGSGAGPVATTQTTTTPGTASATDGGGRLPIDWRGVAVVIVGLLGLLAVRRGGLDGTVGAVRAVPTALAGIVPFGTDDAASDNIVGIKNEGDFEVTCQVQCRTAEETLFHRSFSLAPGDGASLCEQPQEDFEVAVNVQGGPSTAQTVSESGDVGDLVVHLRPDSIKFD